MKVTKKKIIVNRVTMIIAIILGFLIITAYMVLSDINHTNKAVFYFDNFVRNERYDIVRNEVLNRIDEIEYDLSILHEEEKKLIKSKIDMIGNTLAGSALLKIDNMEKRRKEGLKEFERIAQGDKEYLYFALSCDGKLLRSGTDETKEGKSLIDFKDKDGVYFAREMIKAKDNPEGIYVTYHWPKEKDGKPFKKTSFCLYVPELDMIIGTGSYHVDVEQALKEATFSRIQSYYKDSEDYVFIVGYDGTAHVFGDNRLIGTDIKNILDSNGRAIHNLFMETLETENEGFVNYCYYKKNLDEMSEKVSFVKALDRWEAYIGMGFHIDDLNEELDIYVDDIQMESYNKVIVTIIALLFFALVILYFVRRSLQLQSQYMYQEEIVFEQLFQLSSEGILIVSNKGDIMFCNPIIDKMIGENLKKYIGEKGQLNLKSVSEGVYSIESPNGRTYYIECDCKSIIYHDVDSYIYFITNITTNFLKSNELERMALYDELTSLPNRRKLLNDFEDMIEDNSHNQSPVLAMIDIDHFKNVNDKYGHNVGDEVLKLLGECFNGRLRHGDNIYRLGGEEFVVVFNNTTIEDAQGVLKDIMNTFSQWNEELNGFPVTFSAGAIKIDSNLESATSLENLLNDADKLLYQAKNKGRSRVEIHLDKDNDTI
ncbi:cache domain-containing protein [Oceanirhabdus sp. W0125-5]|uniref:cache domain-containing protein n=1 Tax=Oceanirhabdus sp. W0125-5 TaxID=2999116 RepID=UPI0022F2CEC1|nr:cache domain-containing protein [Oceanirhabdus sp. W0125-5]WBW96438.1 cache domain-containing protein [Oceanirhabdus sp. W0125-5]